MSRFLLGTPGDFFSRHQRAALTAVIGLCVTIDWLGNLVAGIL